jgi:hypothetical protein
MSDVFNETDRVNIDKALFRNFCIVLYKKDNKNTKTLNYYNFWFLFNNHGKV